TTQKASFASVIQWLYKTGFTPFRRFAFNLSLLTRRARELSEQRDRSLRVWAATLFGGRIGAEVRWWQFLALAIWQFLYELLRVIYVLMLALLLAGGASILMASSAELLKSAKDAFPKIADRGFTAEDYFTILIFFASVVAFTTVVWSLPKQATDIWRLYKTSPSFVWTLDPLGKPVILRAYFRVLLKQKFNKFRSFLDGFFRRPIFSSLRHSGNSITIPWQQHKAVTSLPSTERPIKELQSNASPAWNFLIRAFEKNPGKIIALLVSMYRLV